MTTHREARAYARAALERVLGASSVNAERFLCGVACLESGYGDWWKGAGKGSHNLGAIQAGEHWTGETFSYTDTHPTDDGGSVPYAAQFRKYATLADAWDDLVRVVYVNCGRSSVLRAAQAGDSLAVSWALRRTRYYEGSGATQEERVARHHKALMRWVSAADAECAAPADGVDRPTLRRGSGYSGGDEREAVRELQQALRIVADGLFGPRTEAVVIAIQHAAGIKTDGIVGPATWAAIDARP